MSFRFLSANRPFGGFFLFRSDLAVFQVVLRNYTAALADIAHVEDLSLLAIQDAGTKT
jgi:hypothetical protein